jgi:hypothetical protein
MATEVATERAAIALVAYAEYWETAIRDARKGCQRLLAELNAATKKESPSVKLLAERMTELVSTSGRFPSVVPTRRQAQGKDMHGIRVDFGDGSLTGLVTGGPVAGIESWAIDISLRSTTGQSAVKVMVAPEPGTRRGWIVDQSGATPPIATLPTQREAIARARQELARLGGGELEIRRPNGRIREARTLGVEENRRSRG